MGNDNVPAFQYISAYKYGNNYVVGGTDVIGLTSAGCFESQHHLGSSQDL